MESMPDIAPLFTLKEMEETIRRVLENELKNVATKSDIANLVKNETLADALKEAERVLMERVHTLLKGYATREDYATHADQITKLNGDVSQLAELQKVAMESIRESVASIQFAVKTTSDSVQQLASRMNTQSSRLDHIDKRITTDEETQDHLLELIASAVGDTRDLQTRFTESITPLHLAVYGGNGQAGLVALTQQQVTQFNLFSDAINMKLTPLLDDLLHRKQRAAARQEAWQKIKTPVLEFLSERAKWIIGAAGIPAGAAMWEIIKSILGG